MFSGQFNARGKNVVVTGGSQGLGAELGRQMVVKGASSVVLIARTESKLKETVLNISKFREDEAQRVSYISADLADYDECLRAVSQLDSAPDIVFLCAGSSIPKLFMDLTPTELQNGVSINYNTSLYFTHAVMKLMTSETVDYERNLVFCSSVLGVFPFIGYGQYAPSKAAIRSLSDVLRHESEHYNIRVSCVYPGNFASEGYEEEEKTKPRITKEIEGASEAISVEKCADIVLWWLDRGYDTVYTDMIGWFLGCGMLGMGPRVFSPLQVLIALLLSIIGPIYIWITRRDIHNYFKSKKTD
jgi:short-subunit dehydrogenase